jgi:hypothetical protein
MSVLFKGKEPDMIMRGFWIEEELVDEPGATSVACHERDYGGQSPTSTRPCESNARRINLDACCMLSHPLEYGIAIFSSGRIGMLLCQALANRDRDAWRGIGQCPTDGVLALE